MSFASKTEKTSTKDYKSAIKVSFMSTSCDRAGQKKEHYWRQTLQPHRRINPCWGVGNGPRMDRPKETTDTQHMLPL